MNIEKDASLNVADIFQMTSGGNDEIPPEKKQPKEKQTVITSNTKVSNPPSNSSSGLENYEHGDIIVGSNGIGGIVIDREKKLQDMVQWDTTLQSVMNLGNQDDVLFDKMALTNNDGKMGKDPAIEYIKNNPNSEAALKLLETKKSFRNYEIGPEGLTNAGDERARKMREAMALVRSGKVVLPTVDEYDRQQLELKRKQGEQRRTEEKTELNPPIVEKQKEIVGEEVSSPMEVTDLIEGMEDDVIMTDEKQKEIMENANMDAFNVTAEREKVVEISKKTEDQPVQQAEKETSASKQQPINLAMLENALKNQENLSAQKEKKTEDQPVQQAEKETDQDNKQLLTIEVPAERASTFMEKMPTSVKEKIEVANKIRVKFTKDLNLPKAARNITDVNSYRRIAPRNVRGDLQAQPLINSGYIGYFMPCGSLKWNNLAPQEMEDDEDFTLDIGKIAQFCYEQLQTTSIGKLSKIQFMTQTSASDIPDMLYAIMKASLPDNQEVNMQCGRKSCTKYFEDNYSIAELPDFDKLSEDAIAMIRELQSSMHMLEDAIDTHDNSPVMQQMEYTASSTDAIFVFKHRDISTVVDRSPAMEGLIDLYGNSSAILSMYITDVYIKIADTGNRDEDYARSTDPSVICEELFRLSSGNLDEVREIVPEIPMIETYSYSIKGEYVCPHCGNTSKNPRQDIMQLVFQVALKARFFV